MNFIFLGSKSCKKNNDFGIPWRRTLGGATDVQKCLNRTTGNNDIDIYIALFFVVTRTAPS